MKKINIIQPVLLLTLLMPLIFFVFNLGFQKRLNENKTPQKKPIFNYQKIISEKELSSKLYTTYYLIKQYKKELESYIKENLAFRYELFEGFKFYRESLGSQILTNKTIEVDNKWFFSGTQHNNVIAEGKGLKNFDEQELNKFIKEVKARDQYCKKKGIKYYMAIIPDKINLYGDKINIIKSDRPTYFDQIKDLDIGVPIIDLSIDLHKHKNTVQLFHRTDSHWTSQAAFLGYQSLMKRLKLDFPEINVLQRQDVYSKTVNNHEQDFMMFINKKEDEKQEYLIPKKRNSKVCKSFKFPKYSTELPNVEYFYKMNFCNDVESPKIFFFRDSFCRDMIPFLRESFKETTFVWVKRFRKAEVDKAKPNVVIDIMTERSISGFSTSYYSINS